MFTFLRILLSGSELAGSVRAKYLAARRSALFIVCLAAIAAIMVMVAVSAIIVAAYLVIAPIVGDFQAALMLAAILIFLAVICGLLAVRRIRIVANAKLVSADPVHNELQPIGHPGEATARQPVEFLLRSVQSPVVISALAVGLLVGRRMMRKSDD